MYIAPLVQHCLGTLWMTKIAIIVSATLSTQVARPKVTLNALGETQQVTSGDVLTGSAALHTRQKKQVLWECCGKV